MQNIKPRFFSVALRLKLFHVKRRALGFLLQGNLLTWGFLLIALALTLSACENSPVTPEDTINQRQESSPIDTTEATAQTVPAAVDDTPDPCSGLGELIRDSKAQTPPKAPGNYDTRADVKVFARQVASCYQLDQAWIEATISQAQYQPSTARLIMPTPAGERNWQKFRSGFLKPNRINPGVQFWQAHQQLLHQAQEVYGVPPEIIIAILGVETVYGKNTGNYRVLDALATLAFDFPEGRSDRTDFFAGELAQFLVFTAREQRVPSSVKGSYAGAMGMPQFMPSSLLKYGVDFDHDGHIDLDNSIPDIIGSVAHYLSVHGWQRGLPPSFPVSMRQNINAQELENLLRPDIVPTFTLQQMAAHGASVVLGRFAENQQVTGSQFSLIALENGAGNAPDYVAGTANFFVITRYNRSSFYAMVVVDLAQAIVQAKVTRAPPSKIAVTS